MESLEIVDKAIENLVEEFKNREDYFFNEHDIHHVFYCKLSSLGDLVHPEYPTRKRFIRIRGKNSGETYENGIHCFEPNIKNGVRGHYDFVVLNKAFYNKYKDNFEKLSNKTVDRDLEIDYPYLDIAIEFKYITGTLDLREIEYDLFKLKQANEAQIKKLIIFNRKGNKNYHENLKTLEKLISSESDLQIQII